MLKIYTDSNFLNPKNRKIVFPLLFDLHFIPNASSNHLYKIISNINDADIVIVPVDINYFYSNEKDKIWLNNFIDNALSLKKIVWIYTAGDYGITIDKDVYTFRASGFESKLNYKTFILPSFINNPYDGKLGISFQPILKDPRPTIGFVGNANGSIKKYISEYVLYLRYCAKRFFKIIHTDAQFFYPSSCKRYNFLKKLQHNKAIKTNFIFRDKYRAGVKKESEKTKTTLEFYQNIQDNPYIFCLRGAGNFSVRFYETLAMGRIPVVIKSDFRLPMHEQIDWSKHCLLLDKLNFESKFIDFHNNISKEHFIKMQSDNLILWNEFLSREPYFEKIHTIFKNKILRGDD
ncbi:MAG: hypothetical protein H7239_01300 [Flavobacterium sp.]|nr:hypothetical protein [Flavobacterium sp.]